MQELYSLVRGMASSFAPSFSTLAGIASLPVAIFVLSDSSAHKTCVVFVDSIVIACLLWQWDLIRARLGWLQSCFSDC